MLSAQLRTDMVSLTISAQIHYSLTRCTDWIQILGQCGWWQLILTNATELPLLLMEILHTCKYLHS